nr:DUF2381 family protein [Corallococcus coralloides]
MLAWGAAAQAQQATRTRAERKRAVTIASTSADPLPIVHVAGDTPTLFLFTSPIQKKTLTFDESRIRVLDAGERSVIIQPVADLGEGERQEIGVFFADGQALTRAAFVLVTDPAEVDSRIDVRRPEPPNTACQPAQAPSLKPEDFVLLGLVDKAGVTTSSRHGEPTVVQGLALDSLVAFRGTGWVLADMTILNSPDQPAWTPQEAMFVRQVGVPLRARLVTKRPGPILPGETMRVLAVVELPQAQADLVFTLEIRGDGGRRFTIPGVRFPQPVAGEAQ